MIEFKPFQIPGCISGMKKMTRWWRITIDTQENITGDQLKQINDMSDKLGWFSFNVHQIENDDIIDLPPLKKIENDEKTPGQRLRSVLYLSWKQNNQGFSNPDDHYKFMMEKLIDYYKERLS